MLFIIFSLIVVVYLPGALVFRVPALGRQRRADLASEERLFWAIVLSLAWSSAVVLALAAAGHYTFGRLLAADAGVAACLVAAFRRKLLWGPSARRPTWTVLMPLALAALGCWLFFPPFEHIVGGKDPGGYLNEGILIAQRGALVIRETIVSSLPPQLRDLFFPSHHMAQYYGTRFMGFFILDPDQGTVVGQFPHLYPAWIAIGYGVDGLRGALATTPLAAMLGLLGVYFAGARLLGRWPALVGATLLALNVATIWFAREPNSEIATQVLLFAALLALARAQVDGDRFFAPVAAGLLGLALFLRIDVVFALAGVGVAAVFQLLEGRRPRLLFLVPLAGMMAAAVAYYLGAAMRVYMMRPIGWAANLYPLLFVLLAAALVTLAALILVSRIERIAAPLRRLLPLALVVAIPAAACYAYFLRMPGGRLAWQDARSLEVFTWYFPPLALATAVAGFSLVVARSFSRAPALLATIAVYAFFVFYKMQIWPEHFWAARRFIPVILPGACLLVGAAMSIVLGAVRRRTPGLQFLAVPLAGLLLVLIGVRVVRADRPIIAHVEYAGVIDRLDALSRRFTDTDLLVVESRDTGSDLHVLAVPLAYVYGRPVLVLNSAKPDKRLFRQFLDWARPRYRHVYFIGGGGTDLVSRSIGVVPVLSDRFQLPEYESRRNGYPQEPRHKEFDFGIYGFTSASGATAAFALDIGHFDDLNVVRFHAKERTEGVPFRWSQRASYIAVPQADKARTLTVWMNDGGRPDRVERAHVSVYWNDRLLGTVDVSHGFNPYSFTIPAEVVPASADPDDAALVRLVTNTWKPRTVLGTPDDRELGVMVRRIEIK